MPPIQLPTTGKFSGLAEQGYINAALASGLLMFKGTIEPTPANSGLDSTAGVWWHHTGYNIIFLKDEDDLNWMPAFYIDEAGKYVGTIANAGTWLTVSGTANAIVLTWPGSIPGTPARGFKMAFKAIFNNTGQTTINGIALYKKSIAGPVVCVGGEIHTDDLVEIGFDGLHWQLLSDGPPPPSIAPSNNTFTGDNIFSGSNSHSGQETFEKILTRQGGGEGAPMAANAVAGLASYDFSQGAHFVTNCNGAAVTIGNPTKQIAGQSGAILLTNIPANAAIAMGSNWHSANGTRPNASGGNDFIFWYCYAPTYLCYSLLQNAA